MKKYKEEAESLSPCFLARIAVSIWQKSNLTILIHKGYIPYGGNLIMRLLNRAYLFTSLISIFIILFKIPDLSAMEFKNPFESLLVDPLTEIFPNLELRGFITSETDFLLHNINDEARSRGFDYQGDDPYISRSEQIFELRYKYYFARGITLRGQLDFLYEASFALDDNVDQRTEKA